MKEDTGISWKVLLIVLGVALLAFLAFVFRNDFANIGKIVNAGKNFTAIFTKDFLWLMVKNFALFLGTGIWAYILAGYGIFFSFVKSGEIVLVELGKSFYKLIPNVPGYGVLDNKIALIDNGAKKPKSFLGIFWIGFYPIQKIHKYEFSWDKIIPKEEAEKEKGKGGRIEEISFSGLVISHRSEPVSSIRFKNSYPIIVAGVELAGQMKIDILFYVNFQSVDPFYSVFTLNGNWFSQANGAFCGIISDFVKGMDLRPKEGSSIPISETFEGLEKEIRFEKLIFEKNKKILSVSGVIASEVTYRDYALSGSKESIAAAEGLKIAQLNYETKVTDAKAKAEEERQKKLGEADGIRFVKKAEAEGIREVKEAEAEGLELKLNAASKHPQGGDIATAQEYAGAIRDFTGSTIIFGGSNVSPMIPVDQRTGKKGVKNGDTTDAV